MGNHNMFFESFTYYRGFAWKKAKRLPEKEDLAKKDPSCVLLKESVWDGHFTASEHSIGTHE